MNIHAIVATRMTSTRLPGKVLIRLIERLRRSKYVQNIVVATTTNREDDAVVEVAKSEGVLYYRGSEEDVLRRTVEAAEAFDTDYIVQVTSDCPLIDAETVNTAIERMLENPYLDYIGNHLVRTYPLGFSAEVFRTRALRDVEQKTVDPHDREHVSLYFYERPEIYHLSNVEAPHYLRHPEYRLTLDTIEDYELIKTVFEKLYLDKPDFDLYDIVRLFGKNPELLQINQHVMQKKAR
jgi:spore coat polysaccharide biosynthesis protein SpsF